MELVFYKSEIQLHKQTEEWLEDRLPVQLEHDLLLSIVVVCFT